MDLGIPDRYFELTVSIPQKKQCYDLHVLLPFVTIGYSFYYGDYPLSFIFNLER